MTDDLELVQDILNGNIESFNTLIYKYESTIYKYILGMIKDREASKDITQEVFITVYNKLYTYSGQFKFSSWLYQIARNKTIDYIRKNKKHVELSIENAWNIASMELLPEQTVEFKETIEDLKSFMKSLDEVERQILILKGSNDKIRFVDIADILKISDSTVKSKYYRLWTKYKNFIKTKEKRCGNDGLQKIL